MAKICNQTDNDTAKILIQALVLSRLDYRKILLWDNAHYQIQKKREY